MTPGAERWLGTTSRFPSGRTAKLVVLVLLLGLVALDTTGGDFDLSRARSWFDLLLPWTPLLAALIGPRIAALVWFGMFAVVVALGADTLMVSGTILPTVIFAGYFAFVAVWRAALIFIVGALVMLAVAMAVNPDRLGLPGVITYATFIVLAAAAGFGLSLLMARIERSARREAELKAQQERVRAEERTRLAYELHDIVANQVTLIAMQARRAEFAGPDKTSEILEHIGDAAGQTLQDLRSLVLLLKSDAGDETGAEAARLEGGAPEAPAPSDDLAEEFARVVRALEEAGFTVEAQIDGPVEGASASVRQILGRTLRELGTNALKHADPSAPIELRMAFRDDGVTLSASNRISTAKPIFSTGTGLEAMRARCEVFGGTLTAAAVDGRWTTAIVLPAAKPIAFDAAEPSA